MASATSIYDFAPLKPSGEPLPMSELKGKVILLVNVASQSVFLSAPILPHLLSGTDTNKTNRCGFTPVHTPLSSLSGIELTAGNSNTKVSKSCTKSTRTRALWSLDSRAISLPGRSPGLMRISKLYFPPLTT